MRWSVKFTNSTSGRSAPSDAAGRAVQAVPPYSCTRERALKGDGSTVTCPGASSGRCTGPSVRTIAFRPSSVAMPSVHQTSSPTSWGPPSRVPPVASSSALIGEGQDPYGSVVTMPTG